LLTATLPTASPRVELISAELNKAQRDLPVTRVTGSSSAGRLGAATGAEVLLVIVGPATVGP
jgi:hypothetical protein